MKKKGKNSNRNVHQKVRNIVPISNAYIQNRGKLIWQKIIYAVYLLLVPRGRSGGAMVLGILPVPGRPTFWIVVGQGSIALAVGSGGSCLDNFTLLYPFSPLSPSLWETAR